MEFKTYIALTIGVFSSAAFAWQPLTYPIRSQSAYQRSIDTAMCYATANRETKVNIAHESQLPPRQPAVTKGTSTGAPSRPPLPSSSFSAMPFGASMPAAASAPAASGTAVTTANNATAMKAASAPAAATAASASAATTTAASASAGSAAVAGNGASETAANGASQPTAGSDVKLPPLPAPEPPMTRYWAAYGACMQARGYVVAQ
ncbi:hypothetical protein B0G76_7841 [Paraburkholderia sp. BL23I1N1]|uniref:hypothetical protein n=1 Tax=Paraburkholderia sp. BL23I1N1 TaxID=1938802 RepID=UPI000E7594D8|nr:hypothetical protein [Paraburkholderia sp. BL23I1N1]RKE26229.1 hypothetical protein B0G76_7841 [Paraburkholderia sp. BL23I1N1]